MHPREGKPNFSESQLAPLLQCEDKSSDHQSVRLDGGAGTVIVHAQEQKSFHPFCRLPALTVERRGQDGPQGDRNKEARTLSPPHGARNSGGDRALTSWGPRPHSCPGVH